MNELDEFLELNNIDGNMLLETVYLDIKEIILKAVCEKLKNDHDFYIKTKKIFFSNSDLEATGKVVYMVCHCKLSEKDTIWMMDCIKAFLGKNERRRTISLEEKKEILYKQNNKCKICGNYIDINNLHVDRQHIKMRGRRYTAPPLTSTCSVVCRSYKWKNIRKVDRAKAPPRVS